LVPRLRVQVLNEQMSTLCHGCTAVRTYKSCYEHSRTSVVLAE